MLSELADTVAACLLDLTNVDIENPTPLPATTDLALTHQLDIEKRAYKSAFRDLEREMTKATAINDERLVREVLSLAESLLEQDGAAIHVTRILWRAAIDAEARIADIIMASRGYDIHFVDDINGRTCIHGAAIAGELRLVNLCIESGIGVNVVDFYGRTALHYAAMNGHNAVCQRLLSLSADPRILDKDNYNALIYAIINGRVECVRALLENQHVTVEPVASITDLIPLSLASQFGHIDIATLLLQRGAIKLPNTNGEYPLHLAAREGHAEMCRMLVEQDGGSGKDTPDKYNEWTPLFHAARYGHTSTVKLLLEAGCNPFAQDEIGNIPVFYAAWHGYIPCAELILEAMENFASERVSLAHRRKITSASPMSDISPPSEGEGEGDMIPSLSLPPPIMPSRTYGHSYLDKTYMIQIALGLPFISTAFAEELFTPLQSTNSMDVSPPANKLPFAASLQPVQLASSLTGASIQQYRPNAHGYSGPSLKLVIAPSSRPDGILISAAPQRITLPLEDDTEVFSFQSHTLDDFALEFSFYPAFGSKPIGRSVVHPFTFRNILLDVKLRGSSPVVLPILDYRLHVIGQVRFKNTMRELN